MENTCLTFVTPTLLAGDRSLVFVLAHEAVHSWQGNLVTNAASQHFWINEGNTMMGERKILAALNGASAFDFDAFSGKFHLQEAISQFVERGQGEYTKLVPDLTGVDPDDAFSSIPYEKGFSLLAVLQERVGKENFEAFLHDYVQVFKYKSITSGDFARYFTAYFLEGRHTLPRVSHSGVPPVHNGNLGPFDPADIPLLAVPNTGDWEVPAAGVSEEEAAEAKQHAIDVSDFDFDSWFNSAGQPPSFAHYDASVRGKVDALADAWIEDAEAVVASGRAKTAVEGWPASHWIAFLERFSSVSADLMAQSPPATFAKQLLEALDQCYDFSSQRNSEIRLGWYTLCLRSAVTSVVPSVVSFLKEQGRMKYVRPMFRELLRTVFGREVAKATFAEHGASYHPICAKMVGVDIEKECAKPALDVKNMRKVGAPDTPKAPAPAPAAADAAETSEAQAEPQAQPESEKVEEEDDEEGEEDEDDDDEEEEEEDSEEGKPKRKARGFGVSVAAARKRHAKKEAKLMQQVLQSGNSSALTTSDKNAREAEKEQDLAKAKAKEEEEDDGLISAAAKAKVSSYRVDLASAEGGAASGGSLVSKIVGVATKPLTAVTMEYSTAERAATVVAAVGAFSVLALGVLYLARR
jgi:hypothetical protein